MESMTAKSCNLLQGNGQNKSVMMTDLHEFLEKSATRHKHLCPRQVLGVRMGMMAAKHLALDLPQVNKGLLTIVETDGCFVDGIEAATDCSIGHRTLRIMDYGKIGATFVDTITGDAIRLAPQKDVREAADNYVPQGKNRWERQLLGYQRMPEFELFTMEQVELIVPIEEIVSRPGLRFLCDECGEEIINEREINIDDQILCRACAGYGYYFSAIGRDEIEVLCNKQSNLSLSNNELQEG